MFLIFRKLTKCFLPGQPVRPLAEFQVSKTVTIQRREIASQCTQVGLTQNIGEDYPFLSLGRS
jgi:hypothetical protein